MIKIVECPRDAMQGLSHFIPTEVKATYLNQLLKVGFDTLDFGSFVSPQVIPQMRDTAEVLARLDLGVNSTKLLAIVANRRGAETALGFKEIYFLGYPLSISETFQLRNTRKTIAESWKLLEEMQNLCVQGGKTLFVYLSMAFGNPYQDPHNPEIAEEFAQKLRDLGIRYISLADTIGSSTPENIDQLFRTLIPRFPEVEFSAHLHATPQQVLTKMEAAYQAGCRRFEGALLGFGGCPMAQDDLVGNMPTEQIITYLDQIQAKLSINKEAFEKARLEATQVFFHEAMR
ncbi:MAG: hydroxymethylglutaryl-CoA lyase [Microscillaceae bacterium]|nr:hydroxymethylglutaryl-CoA lyase [Microscillaceae bacterium]